MNRHTIFNSAAFKNPMKAISFVLLIFMLVISVVPGNAKPVNNTTKTDCCHKMGCKPQKRHSKSGCDGGMCATVLSCNNCCFLKTEPLKIDGVTAIINVNNATPYLAGNLSDYSITYWNPPKV